jgi:hypothetical protein
VSSRSSWRSRSLCDVAVACDVAVSCDVAAACGVAVARGVAVACDVAIAQECRCESCKQLQCAVDFQPCIHASLKKNLGVKLRLSCTCLHDLTHTYMYIHTYIHTYRCEASEELPWAVEPLNDAKTAIEPYVTTNRVFLKVCACICCVCVYIYIYTYIALNNAKTAIEPYVTPGWAVPFRRALSLYAYMCQGYTITHTHMYMHIHVQSPWVGTSLPTDAVPMAGITTLRNTCDVDFDLTKRSDTGQIT